MKTDMSKNKFLKVLIATQRAKQIRNGARPLVETSMTRATRIALEEVERGLIGFEFLPPPEPKSTMSPMSPISNAAPPEKLPKEVVGLLVSQPHGAGVPPFPYSS